jgi:effector-binding domain-containing protein
MTDSTERFAMREPQIEQRAGQPYVAIRRPVTDGLPAVVDTAFPELFGWLGSHSVEPVGPPFIRYREVARAGEPLDVEIGAPVATPVPGDDGVSGGVLPAGRYVTLLHVGPYRSETARDLGDAQAELVRWIEEHDVVCGRPSERGTVLECSLEHYRLGPESDADPSEWETEIACLIVEE